MSCLVTAGCLLLARTGEPRPDRAARTTILRTAIRDGALAAGPVVRRFGTAPGPLLCELFTAPFAPLIPLGDRGWGLVFLVAGGFVLSAGVVASDVSGAGCRPAYCPRELMGRVTASSQFVNYGAIPSVRCSAAGSAGPSGCARPSGLMTAGLALGSLVLLIGPIRTAWTCRRRRAPLAPRPRWGRTWAPR